MRLHFDEKGGGIVYMSLVKQFEHFPQNVRVIEVVQGHPRPLTHQLELRVQSVLAVAEKK